MLKRVVPDKLRVLVYTPLIFWLHPSPSCYLMVQFVLKLLHLRILTVAAGFDWPNYHF
jgi:hypothetical protein